MRNKMKITWIVNSYGTHSMHINGPLSFKDGYLGHVFKEEDEWFFVTNKEKRVGPFETMARAMRELEKEFNSEQV